MITAEQKTELIEKFRTHDGDTGSCEIQIAILTKRIKQITEHLKKHKKDHATRRGLLMLVSRRSTLLRYLKKCSMERYQSIVKRLKLRK